MKSNLVQVVEAQRRILRAIFRGKKLESLRNNLSEKRILTVFELYIIEVFKELFKQLRCKKNQYFTYKKNHIARMKASKTERLLQPKLCRTILKKKLMEKVLRTAYNWLEHMSLIPDYLKMMSSFSLKQYISQLSLLYVIDNKSLFDLFF